MSLLGMILDRLTRHTLSKERATTTTRLFPLTRVAHASRNVAAKTWRRLHKVSRRIGKRIAIDRVVAPVKSFVTVTLPGHTRVWLHRHRRRLVRLLTAPMQRRLPTAMRYYAHEWLLTNRESRRLYQHAAPDLDRTQQAIVDALHRTGLAVVSFDELFRGSAQWPRLTADAAAFRREVEARLGDSASRGVTKKKVTSGGDTLATWSCRFATSGCRWLRRAASWTW
jgi:hypothetical protein